MSDADNIAELERRLAASERRQALSLEAIAREITDLQRRIAQIEATRGVALDPLAPPYTIT